MEVARFGVDVVVVQPGAIASRFGDASAVGLERYRSPESWYNDVYVPQYREKGKGGKNGNPGKGHGKKKHDD